MTREEHTDSLLEALHDVRTHEDLIEVFVAWTNYHIDQREDHVMGFVLYEATRSFDGLDDRLIGRLSLLRLAQAARDARPRIGDALLKVNTMDELEVERLRMGARLLVLERLSHLYDYKPTTSELRRLRVGYYTTQRAEKGAQR